MVNVTGPRNASVCSDSPVATAAFNVSSGRVGLLVTRVTAIAVGVGVPTSCSVSPSANGESPKAAHVAGRVLPASAK